jgi:tetratricopeptide (TPR) repeat protein
MKKVFLMLMVGILCVSVWAQNDSKAKSLEKDIAKSDIAVQDAKKGVNPNTWLDRGKLFVDAYGVNIHFLRANMSIQEATLFLGKPIATPEATTDESGKSIETHTYSRIKLTFEQGVLVSWVETATVAPEPLKEAVKSYQKAKELDEKGKLTKKIEDGLKVVASDLEGKAFNEYALKDFNAAYLSAKDKIAVSEMLGYSDTIYHYYAGFFAYAQSELDKTLWKESIFHFDKALALGFKDADPVLLYGMLYTACTSVGDTAKGLSYVEKGFALNPNDLGLIYIMINYYLERNESEKALAYVAKAKAGDPTNGTLLFAEGSLHDKLGHREEALVAYDAAIALEPTNYSYYYNKGVVYFNYAVKLYEEADKAKTNAEYDKWKDLADKEFVNAVAPMEKALELHDNDRDIMETLKNLYFRLRTLYPDMEGKYDDTVKKLEQL